MRVLLTRPREDSEQLAELLRARGHLPIFSPVLDIGFLDGPEVVLDDAQAILATSANGIRGFARRSRQRDLPVFAVGPQTATASKDAGFTRVIADAGGTNRTLLRRARCCDALFSTERNGIRKTSAGGTA
jgi:uroporphyrinogen-III synthase